MGSSISVPLRITILFPIRQHLYGGNKCPYITRAKEKDSIKICSNDMLVFKGPSYDEQLFSLL